MILEIKGKWSLEKRLEMKVTLKQPKKDTEDDTIMSKCKCPRTRITSRVAARFFPSTVSGMIFRLFCW